MFPSPVFKTPTSSSTISPLSSIAGLATPQRVLRPSTPSSSLTSPQYLDTFISRYTMQEENRTSDEHPSLGDSMPNTVYPSMMRYTM
jgi:hypothetical protein